MSYELQLENYQGPLEKLLELIEEKKFEVTTVSIAAVTADFLKYLRMIGEKASPRALADFLVVAAKLVLIKSKALLPILELTEEEEIEIHDLESRLKAYQEWKQAEAHLQPLADRGRRAYAREFLASLGDSAGVFYPPQGLSANDIIGAAAQLLSTLRDLAPDVTTLKVAMVSLEEKVSELLRRLAESARATFRDLAHEKSRSDIIVLFLAILHMMKEKIISVAQDGQFGDIMISKNV